MKILERILAGAIVIALILKFNLVPGGDVLLLWSMLILGCIYYPLGFLFFNQIRLRNVFRKDAYKHVTGLSIGLAIVAGLGLSIVVVGSLFKFLNLTGANVMLMAGSVVTVIVFIISLTLLLRTHDATGRFILWRAGIIGVAGIFLLLTPVVSIVKFQYRNHPKYIEAYTDYLADPGNVELHRNMELEDARIKLTEEEFKAYERIHER